MQMWNRKGQQKNPAPGRGLDRRTEAELAARARDHGDIEARNLLVESHLGLVRRMATAFARRGASFEDLVQEGGLALMRAAQTFEPERNLRFATYAAYWIRSHMQRYLASLRSYQYAAPASVAYSGGHSRGSAGARRLLRTTSLDAPVDSASDHALIDSIRSELGTPEETFERIESRDRVRRALVKAYRAIEDDRAAVVIERRLLSDDPATLAEIGRALDLSREGARLLELRLIHRMRSEMTERAA
ncbi:MAG: sigma-70 family RNA polymerase sigma factor [Deltaproteobacteria bacterium]|nr:sigma-70 family RNA polymerase sigma factor [Deltaproteobacteria bacterium]